MENNLSTELKLPIEKEFKERLKIFFMSIVSNIAPPGLSPNIQLKENIGVIGYRHQDALEEVRKKYNEIGTNIISFNNFKYIDDLFREINTSEIKQDLGSLPSLIIPQEKITINQFVERLTLVADEYCTPKDKDTLLNILERVNLKKVGHN